MEWDKQMLSKIGKIAIAKGEEWKFPMVLFYQSFVALIRGLASGKVRVKEVVRQTYESSVLSVPIILFSMGVVSLMSVLEFSWHMKMVLRQDALVPGFSMVLMIREVAPVVTAMLLASRVGASIAAELGVMRITDQLEQLKLLAVSEIDFLLIPRWIACLVATMTSCLIALATFVVVSTLIGSRGMGYQAREFFNVLFIFTRGHDLFGSLLKTIIFGTVIPFVSSGYGLKCLGGSREVGKAATRAVVVSSLMIIILDFIINSLFWMP